MTTLGALALTTSDRTVTTPPPHRSDRPARTTNRGATIPGISRPHPTTERTDP
jgi:hypothetical protein